MGWLRNLLLGLDDGKPPRYGIGQQDPDPIDWIAIESRLVPLAEQHLQSFADKHPSESFYGLGFDCHSEEGQVLLCLNTRVAQLAGARKALQQHPDFNQGKTEREVATSIEWGFGDWKYQGINVRSKSWSKGWRNVEADIATAVGMLAINRKFKAMQELRESFMEMTSRALLRIECSDAISALRRDTDFRTLCTDHDEGPSEGFSRMQRIAGRNFGQFVQADRTL
jgi:hypothetical protein